MDIGRGHLPIDALARALESKSRADLGVTAPAEGLYLASVELSEWGSDRWPEPIPDADRI
jgi:tRNA U38,U39,U40 pseudouridine synthase TruA